MPVTAPDKVTITNLRHCARCGGDHPELVAAPLAQPFAPPEAAGVTWSHWMACPTNGEPILVRTDVEPIGMDIKLAQYVYGDATDPKDHPLTPAELEMLAEDEGVQPAGLGARAVREIRLLRAALLSKADAPLPYKLDAIVNGERRSLTGLSHDGRITVTLDTLNGEVDAVIASANHPVAQAMPKETELSRAAAHLDELGGKS